MKIRIELTEKNCTLTPIPTVSEANKSDATYLSEASPTVPASKEAGTVEAFPTVPVSEEAGRAAEEAGTGGAEEEPVVPELGLTLAAAELEAYASSRHTHPVTDVTVTVPDGDIPVVEAWAGTGVATATPPSDILLKRITSAVMGAINRYFTDAARAGLFTRPLRVACALRLKDGKYAAVGTPRLLTPADRAPLVVIRELQFGGTTLRTRVELMNTPQTLTADIPAFEVPADLAEKVTHLDIIATRQCDVLAGDESVEGIRSYTLYGENVRIWNYRRLEADVVAEAAENDRAFRVIASVPITEATPGKTGIRLPLGRKNLDDWESFPKADIDSAGGKDPDQPDEPEVPHTHVMLATEPLDLGLPEREKRVRGVTLRGLFERDADDIEMTLYASHHRERWHRLATSRGPHIRFLRAVRCRWLRVEARLRREAKVDALTFSIADHRD